ncbi:hypothetical protein [Vagococcus fluvialis]|uniref:hypothetical protein n=1 Tax=Vagococcus fluvialis TaxID=2738 RepID=UPI001A8DCC78|nr:hypothetical protein [Vagococcus fluvialis]MBO0487010.1 hypothetical protein [Vagococcus fluvialis]
MDADYFEQVITSDKGDRYLVRVTDKFISYGNTKIPLRQIAGVSISYYEKVFPSKSIIAIMIGLLMCWLGTKLTFIWIPGLLTLAGAILVIYSWSKNKEIGIITFDTSSAKNHQVRANNLDIKKLRDIETHLLDRMAYL